jgi:hypothetical protein
MYLKANYSRPDRIGSILIPEAVSLQNHFFRNAKSRSRRLCFKSNMVYGGVQKSGVHWGSQLHLSLLGAVPVSISHTGSSLH